jgi:hypothetical protein
MRNTLLYGLLIASALVLTSGNVVGQDKTKSPPKPKERFVDRLYTGGNLGLSFGSITFIDISPLLGYRVNDDASIGVGATYNYFRTKVTDQFGRSHGTFSTSYYGGRLFGRYFFTDALFAHAEYEVLNLEYITEVDLNDPDPIKTTRTWIGSPLVGGGYASRMSKHSYWFIMILYNLNELSPWISPYPNPLIRMGAVVSL